MATLGFKHFFGVDCSEGMLEQARLTGLYQDVQQALLGTQELPVEEGQTHSDMSFCHRKSKFIWYLTDVFRSLFLRGV